MKSFRDIRVIPVVLVAIFGLMVLKIAGQIGRASCRERV